MVSEWNHKRRLRGARRGGGDALNNDWGRETYHSPFHNNFYFLLNTFIFTIKIRRFLDSGLDSFVLLSVEKCEIGPNEIEESV